MGKVKISPQVAQSIRIQVSDGIGRDMLRRGKRVETAAKKRISTSPKRVNSGRLRSDIKAIPWPYLWTLGCRVGTNVEYALLVHNGTGIYGPQHTPIVPKRAKYLKFTPKGAKAPMYRKSVKGMKPNPYLRDALPAAHG